MKNCVIYLRSSTWKQGDSIRRQMQYCMDYASKHGLHIVDVFCDKGRSGYEPHKLVARNRLIDAYADAPTKPLVLVEMMDRWGRMPTKWDAHFDIVECMREQWISDALASAEHKR
jgi:DNA invertase Pin-like site-specific DNA recombinase